MLIFDYINHHEGIFFSSHGFVPWNCCLEYHRVHPWKNNWKKYVTNDLAAHVALLKYMEPSKS